MSARYSGIWDVSNANCFKETGPPQTVLFTSIKEERFIGKSMLKRQPWGNKKILKEVQRMTQSWWEERGAFVLWGRRGSNVAYGFVEGSHAW